VFGLFGLIRQCLGVVFAIDLAFGEIEMFEVVMGVCDLVMFVG
jgi:hypothetical protein